MPTTTMRMVRTTILETRLHRPLEQVLIMQAQMLQTMQQTMVNMQQNQQAPQPQQRDRLGDFQRTKSPSFLHFVELMDADDWLKTV
jgi:hypothetical protein